MATDASTWTWNDVVAQLGDKPIGHIAQVAVSAVENPESAGLLQMPANPDGQKVFGAVVNESLGLVVQCVGENYEARLCQLTLPTAAAQVARPTVASPTVPATPVPRQQMGLAPPQQTAMAQRIAPSSSPIPVLVDSPTETALQRRSEQHSLANIFTEMPGTALLGCTTAGLLLGWLIGGREGAFAGALVGGGLGMASIAVSNAATSPAIAQTAQLMYLCLVSASLTGKAGAGPIFRLGAKRPVPALPPFYDDEPPPPRRPRKK